jgi:hypothetical protein
MGKVVELSDDTYHALATLAQHQQRTLEEMFRLCLGAYAARVDPPPPRAPEPEEPATDLLSDSEQPVVLAYQRPPVQRLPGVVRTIRPSDPTPALTDAEWQTLGLEETPEA